MKILSELDGIVAAGQIPGDRPYQEDDFGLHTGSDSRGLKQHLLLLADGMGGHAAGDVASELAIHEFVRGFKESVGPTTDRLTAALEVANNSIAEAIVHKPALKGMGCTLVAAVITEASVEWISVGDSPFWVARNGQLQRLNADHSMKPVIDLMVETGEITAEKADRDGSRNFLRSALTGEPVAHIDVSSQPFGLRSGDRLLIASDGVESLDEDELTSVLSSHAESNVAEIVSAVLSAVDYKSITGQDNATLMMYEYSELESEEFDDVNEQKGKSKTGVLAFVAMSLVLTGLIAAGAQLYGSTFGFKSTPRPLTVEPLDVVTSKVPLTLSRSDALVNRQHHDGVGP